VPRPPGLAKDRRSARGQRSSTESSPFVRRQAPAVRPWREQNVEEASPEIWQFGNDAETRSPGMMLSMPKLPGSKADDREDRA
jgi:hypothetical protein